MVDLHVLMKLSSHFEWHSAFSFMSILEWFNSDWVYIHPTYDWLHAQPYQKQNNKKTKTSFWSKNQLETLDSDRADGSFHYYIHQIKKRTIQVVHSLLNYIHLL